MTLKTQSPAYTCARRDAAAAAAAAAAVAETHAVPRLRRGGLRRDAPDKAAIAPLNMMVQRADINSAVGINTNAVKSARVATVSFVANSAACSARASPPTWTPPRRLKP